MKLQRRLQRVIAIVVAMSVGATISAAADEDVGEWSFVVTPQLWLTHVAKNGFVAPTNNVLGGHFATDSEANPIQDDFHSNSEPTHSLNQQWGVQLAAQKGRWTFALAYQFVDFGTQTDVIFEGPPTHYINQDLEPGDVIAREVIDTSRHDVDLATTYLFPDVIPMRLDAALGAGIKLIYTDAARQHTNLSPAAELISSDLGGLYQVCRNGDCARATFQYHVKSTSWMYGFTVPMSVVFHLTDDSTWLVPVNVSPFIGAQSRDDNDVAYNYKYRADGFFDGVKREDGTSFAYGVTSDVTLRWMFTDTFSAYLGMRVQYMKADGEPYLAYGPLIGISARYWPGE